MHRSITLVSIFALVALAGCKDDPPKSCDITTPSCADGFACIADADGESGSCLASCDLLDPGACSGETMCEPVVGGGSACFEPVVFSGRVFDAADDAAIADATVLAANASGIVVTSVSLSDAAGAYALSVPVLRDATGAPVDGTFTLRVSVDDYLGYPEGIRPAIPIDATAATFDEASGRWLLSNASTDVSLIALPLNEQGQASVSGTVGGELSGGSLVVVECGAPPCPFGYADLDGSFVIHNVPDGSYEIRSYKAGHQTTPTMITVAGVDLTGVDLAASEAGLASVTGSVSIVNAPGGSLTSVVLIPVNTFQQITSSFVRGEIAPGLRAPEPGLAPNISGAYTIEGVPEGSYKVLAAFENDLLIRDPDPGIAGTQIVEITVPDPTEGLTITVDSSFKVTEALAIVSPGATGPEAVDPLSPLNLVFESDSSTPTYDVTVYDAFGNEVWSLNVPDTAGSAPISVPYAGPLDSGMYYQFRAVSLSNALAPRSTTEDLLGVFYVP